MSSARSPDLTFDHIGIVTSDVEQASATFGSDIGAVSISQKFDDHKLGVTVQFIKDSAGIVYEMIAPLGTKSPVAKALATKSNLLNQIAYRTVSISRAGADLRNSGSFPLGVAMPAVAFGGALVQFFFHPLGFVIELIEVQDYSLFFSPFTRGSKDNSE